MEPVTATIRRTGRGYGVRLTPDASPLRSEESDLRSDGGQLRPRASDAEGGGLRVCLAAGEEQLRPLLRNPVRTEERQLRPRERAPSGICPAAGGDPSGRIPLGGILLADQRNAPSRSRLRPAHPIDLRRSDCRAGGPSSFGAPCSVQSETYPGISFPSSATERLKSQIATIFICLGYSGSKVTPSVNSTQKCTEVGAPSSDLPTDHRRSDCLSESHQPRALLPRCTRDTRASRGRRQAETKRKYRSLRIFLYNLHILA